MLSVPLKPSHNLRSQSHKERVSPIYNSTPHCAPSLDPLLLDIHFITGSRNRTKTGGLHPFTRRQRNSGNFRGTLVQNSSLAASLSLFCYSWSGGAAQSSITPGAFLTPPPTQACFHSLSLLLRALLLLHHHHPHHDHHRLLLLLLTSSCPFLLFLHCLFAVSFLYSYSMSSSFPSVPSLYYSSVPPFPILL